VTRPGIGRKCIESDQSLNTDMQPIDRLRNQVNATLQMLRYFLLMQETFPWVMLQLNPEQLTPLQPQILAWIEFCREVYQQPELGCSPPDPLPVDPDCPPHLLSDHTLERIGRNAPFFDFVNAPFTHPIGTQISVTCITSVWNSYDTFVKEQLRQITTANPNHQRVINLTNAEEADPQQSLPTDRKLEILSVDVRAADFEAAATDTGKPHFRPDLADALTKAGKQIRAVFTHRYGEPSDQLVRIMREIPFEQLGFRMTDRGFEVTLFGARNIIEVMLLRAEVISGRSISFLGSQPAIGG
jgi:hypothetical protein